MSYRSKVIVFFFCALGLFAAAGGTSSVLQTLSRLDQVEAERDQWQRPSTVLQALDLRPGDSVVDLGCGSGYFSLKLSQPVGSKGRVIAEDIRTLPLTFLWLRTHRNHLGNISIVRGQPTDPHLPSGVTVVLIANTYHELADAQLILAHVKESLVSGGRLVVLDRAPSPMGTDATGIAEHEISSQRVERELQQAGFALVSRDDHFISRDPENTSWWLVVARKP